MTILGYRVFPSEAGATRLRAALDKAAGAPFENTPALGFRHVGSGRHAPMGTTTSVASLHAEPGGARVAVAITARTDAYHGVSVDLPEQSPAEVVIDARTGRVPTLPWET